MFKKWSRIALASFLVLMLGASIAFATTARVRSLANTGDYISDDSAVNRWYSTLPSFSNQVNAEIGQWNGISLADTRGLGWIHACGEDGKWGTYRISLNENAIDHPGFWIGNPFYTVHVPGFADHLGDPFGFGLWNDTPINKWDIAGGWELGEAIALGLSITQSKWNAEDTASDAEASNSFFTVGAGFTWTNNDDMVFDGALTYGSAGGDVSIGTTASAEWDSKTAIDFAARLFWDWKDYVTLVPVVEYATSEYSLTYTATPPAPIATPNGDKISDFMLGVGLNMDVNQDNMLVFALEFMNRTWEYANPDTAAAGLAKTTWSYMPTVRLALESNVTSWLTTRIGAAKYLGSVKDETNGGEETKETPGVPTSIGTGIPGFDWFLGCGFNVAEWTIDLELAHETPFSLGYWLTGYSGFGSAGPVARISGVYNY
jgi:hypothetical protein